MDQTLRQCSNRNKSSSRSSIASATKSFQHARHCIKHFREHSEYVSLKITQHPYLKRITNKDLLNSTGNSAQCYVAAWMGGEFGQEMDTCICMAESFCSSPETIRTLLISYTPIQSKKLKLGKRLKKKNHSAPKCLFQLERIPHCMSLVVEQGFTPYC